MESPIIVCVPEKSPKTFPSVEFVKMGKELLNPQICLIINYLKEKLSKSLGLIVSDNICHPVTDGFNLKGTGFVQTLFTSFNDQMLQGIYIFLEKEKFELWAEKAASELIAAFVVSKVFEQLGIPIMITKRNCDTVIVNLKFDGTIFTVFEVKQMVFLGKRFAEFKVIKDTICHLDDPCLLPSTIAQPQVIILCHQRCICSSQNTIKKRLQGLTVAVSHEDIGVVHRLPHTGTSLLIAAVEEGYILWKRTNGLKTSLVESLEKDLIVAQLDEIDKQIWSTEAGSADDFGI